MSILIVDDSKESVYLIQTILRKAGYTDLVTAGSAKDAFKHLSLSNYGKKGNPVELILLDIIMPDMDGIEALKQLKEVDAISEIPVVMVTANTEDKDLEKAFDLGAVDYVTKPFSRIELLARVRSVLRLKHEMDRRVQLSNELEAANRQLRWLTLTDGLTSVANRRHFDITLDNEWKRAYRYKNPVSLVMIDIDYFKKYNDYLGHQAGDDCLVKVADALKTVAKRSLDLLARYGGEEFALILPDTNLVHALDLAESARATVESLKLEHGGSEESEYVTISLGVATIVPCEASSPEDLIKAADTALYKSKEAGRNKVSSSNDVNK